MFKNERKEKFSLRKYKNGRTDSKLIGAISILGLAMFAGGGTALANVSSDMKNETTIVNEFDKVLSSAKTTFTDDQNPAKKVTVDVVADIRYNQPTKANQNIGDPDGTDRVKFSRKATVNYLLEEDHSKIAESKIYEEKGNVYTNYDKKGISYDTDGKAYRGSGIERTGDEINKDTGGGFRLEANNKEYQLVRSEIVDENKATYEKTHFNDIEAPVSPEGMHNYLGEINYGKITGKVYLVEEISDGHYGKFVEASGVSSDEDAVAKWKNGQETAKNFTKENVTLQEGDTILVMDKDTYAHGSGRRTVNRVEYSREKIPATPEYNELASSEEIRNVNGYPTYAFGNEILNDSFLTIGKDGVFGTSDDGEVTFKNEEHLRYERNWKIGNQFSEMTDVPDVDFRKMSVNEILRYMQSEVYGVLEYFDHYAKTDAERQEIQERRTRLDQNIDDAAEMIKNENIDIAAQSWRLAFLSTDKEKLTALRKHIESGEKVLDELLLTLKTDEENVAQYGNYKNVKKITKEVLYYEVDPKDIYGYRYGYPKFSYRTVISYHKDAEPEHYSEWKKDYPEVETREDPVYTNKGVVTISDDLSKIKVVNAESTKRETEFTKQDVSTKEETDYVVKEIITPVRAYKVMGEGSPVINHYYKMITNRAMIPSHVRDEKVGTLMVQYVSNTGEKLRSDIVYEVPYEIRKIYDVFSGKTKVGEESVVEKITPVYDTTPERFNTITADKTGFTYEFEALAVDSEPETSVIDKAQTIVKYVYRLVSKEDPNPVKKEVKGSVIVKYVDAEGNEIKPAETLVNDAVLRTTYTYITKSGNKVVSTRDKVEDWQIPDYNAKDKWIEKITTTDGKNYEYQGIYAVSEKFNNTTAETGKVAEGITTVVYQYELAKPKWKVPTDSPKEEVPEFKGEVENPELDKKGTVIVKYVDSNGHKIADDVVVKDNVVVAKAKTNFKEAANKTTYTPTDEVYSITPKQTIEVDGVTYKLKGLLPISKELKNSVVEKGAVQEGVTTIIYRYALQVKAPISEVPEFGGGVSSAEPPVVEISEFKGGVSSAEPPVTEVPEFGGGVSSAEPPIAEIPEFKGGVSPVAPAIIEIPKYKGGVSPVEPVIQEVPEYKGDPAVLEVPGYRVSSFVNPDEYIPNPKYQLQNLPTVERLEKNIVMLDSKNIIKSERLPNTGNSSSDGRSLGFAAILVGISIAVKRRQKEE